MGSPAFFIGTFENNFLGVKNDAPVKSQRVKTLMF
jgi:hypothetical protein